MIVIKHFIESMGYVVVAFYAILYVCVVTHAAWFYTNAAWRGVRSSVAWLTRKIRG